MLKFLKNLSFVLKSAQRNISDAAGKKGLVLGVYDGCNEGEVLYTKATERVNSDLGGKLYETLKGMSIRLGEVQVFSNLHPEFGSIAISGTGKVNAEYSEVEALDESRENIRISAGLGAMALQDLGIGHMYVEGYTDPEAAAEGATLGVWKYQEFISEDNKTPPVKLELFDVGASPGDKGDSAPAQSAWDMGCVKATAQNMARTLEEAPGNVLTPTAFANEAIRLLCPCGVQVDVRDKDWLESKKMNAFLTMAKGSCETPLLLEIGYCGGEPMDKPVVFIGKGITFSTGGLCLQSPEAMAESRADMAGAAVIVGTLRAIAQMNLPMNVIGLIPLAENMTGGLVMKPGDVVLSLNGKSIRIENTDHDGRVAMSDALVYSDHFKPCLDVSIATLTDGMKKALGFAGTGVFTTSEIVWREFQRAGGDTGDRVWRFPFWRYYKKKITGYVGVDVNNVGKSRGAACLGAAFLAEFVPEGVDFAHMDITGTGMISSGVGHPYLRKGLMSGRPTRTIIQFLYQMACPHEKLDE